jgi:L-ascorbate metabolism protein UlaG (beta-lactamase superfamily)
VPNSEPTSVTLRAYQVGFGDCFLLSFDYAGRRRTRRVLIDFGTTSLPKGAGRKSMLDIARNIADVCEGRLDAIVVTHRHKDHLSGFAGEAGEVIAALRPEVVIQPWTEDPDVAVDATRPTPHARFRMALAAMHDVATYALEEVLRNGQGFTKTVRDQLAFLGEDNLSNAEAVTNLIEMDCRHVYAHYGSRSGLEKILPGVTAHVLGPPTLEQSEAIRRQRDEDADEFWHLQAQAGRPAARQLPRLFEKAETISADELPVQTRWFTKRLNAIRGDELLEIVRALDHAMNNTSLILLFEIGPKKLLFSGDAQIENWTYALKTAPDAEQIRALLADVAVYKVGHHGSLNATPKTLWNLFDRKGEDATDLNRLCTLMSTMAGKHGQKSRGTEVPREKLVSALKSQSKHHSTQRLTGGTFFEDIVIEI